MYEHPDNSMKGLSCKIELTALLWKSFIKMLQQKLQISCGSWSLPCCNLFFTFVFQKCYNNPIPEMYVYIWIENELKFITYEIGDFFPEKV